MRKLGCLLAVVALLAATMNKYGEAQDRSTARSMVIAREGIVAAESPLAAQAGAMILARGGNAADAAVAANAVMGLVAPMSNGIGGDLFTIVYDAKTNKIYGLNASGWSPAAMTLEKMRAKHGDRDPIPERGIDSVTVPGAVDGWAKLLDRFGSMKFAEVLAPAIHYAQEGFAATELVAGVWEASEGRARREPETAATYLVDNRAPRVGEIFRNPGLAWTYKQIAAGGRDAFYRGEVAERIVALSKEKEGFYEAADLAEFSSEWVEPISTTYRGWTVFEIPPNGQGIAALMMLNLMEQFPLATHGHNSADALHTMIEAKKLAYADMRRYVADQRFANVPVTGLLSKDYARERARGIAAGKANCEVSPGEPIKHAGDTVHLAAVDREGNMVSLIQSNYQSSGFASGLVARGTGFALQNRGALFSGDPASPNVVAPRKRPLHTIIPAMMTRGDLRIAFGIMGGWNQSQAHAQFVANVADFGMNIQQALEAARFTKPTFSGCDLMIESRVPEKVRAALEARGHKLEVRGEYSPQMGGGQAVMRDYAKGINFGASSPRKDGAAVPEPAVKQSSRP